MIEHVCCNAKGNALGIFAVKGPGGKSMHLYVCTGCGDMDRGSDSVQRHTEWRGRHLRTCGNAQRSITNGVDTWGTTAKYLLATQAGEVRDPVYDKSRKTTDGRYGWHKA